jgi:hypothetical protein
MSNATTKQETNTHNFVKFGPLRKKRFRGMAVGEIREIDLSLGACAALLHAQVKTGKTFSWYKADGKVIVRRDS